MTETYSYYDDEQIRGLIMGVMRWLFGAKAAAPASVPSGPASQFHSQMPSSMAQHQPLSQSATRRELLRVVLRETLQRHGIPSQWIGAECLTATSRTGERGIHWRLLIKHWDPRLLMHCVAIQNALIKRVMTFDPVASVWLSGISWQFALADESECPPLPHPGSWTSEPHEARNAAPVAVAQGDATVIEGPVHIASPVQPAPAPSESDAARADLDKLLAIRDADFREHAEGDQLPAWTRTEPAKLTEQR
jgi:hypothetical protein